MSKAIIYTASMSMPIVVGFGQATVSRDGQVIYDGIEAEDHATCNEDFLTVSDIEKLAKMNPGHDWKIHINGPLHEELYSRNKKGEWVLIKEGKGFA